MPNNSNYLAPQTPQYGGNPAQSRSWLSDVVNSVGGVVGIKPFKGGPYPDSGHLDDAQNAINNYTPIKDMGAISGLPQMYSQLAQQNGLPDPFREMMQSQWQKNNPATGSDFGQDEWFQKPYTPSNDPYALSQPTQRYLNQKQSDIGAAHQAAWQGMKARLSARGLGDSNTLDAAEAYYNQTYGNQGQQAETAVRGAEFDRKQQMSEYLANALMQLFNAQRQHSLDQVGVYQNQADLSEAETNNRNNFIRSLIAPFAAKGVGGFMGGGGGSGLNAGAGSGGTYGIG